MMRRMPALLHSAGERRHPPGASFPCVRVAIVVGNPKAQSRTLMVARAVAEMLGPVTGDADQLVVDLAEVGPDLLDFSSSAVGELIAAVAASDLVVVASPTFKATYTGILKLFLDRYGNNGLVETVAVPVMTGAGPGHTLAPEVHLRPLLVELGASVPTRGVYVTEDQFADLPVALAGWAETAVPRLRRALA